MSYTVTMGYIARNDDITVDGMRFEMSYILYDSRGDSIEGQSDKPWVTDQNLQLSKKQIGSYECNIPYTLWHDLHGLAREDFIERQLTVLVEQDNGILFVGYLTEKDLTFDRAMHVYFTEALGMYDESDIIVESKSYMLTCAADGTHVSDVNEPDAANPSLWYKLFSDSTVSSGILSPNLVAPTVARGVTKDLSDEGQQSGTAWSFIQKYFLDEYDGYLYLTYEWSTKSPGCFKMLLHYDLDITNKTNQTVEYGKNLLDLEVSEKLPSNFCNEVMAWGTSTTTKGWWIFKKTKTSRVLGGAYDWDSIDKYGAVSKDIFVDGNSTEENLKKVAKEELDNCDTVPEKTITLTAYDLVDVGLQTDRLGYMKKTHVLAPKHGVDGWYVCTKVSIDPGDPASTQFTFGNPPKKLTDQQNKVTTQLAGTAMMVGGVMGYLNM